jgi:hypothetical protein
VTNHRYFLGRELIGNGGRVNFVMLNPSTADDVFDDATIRRCIGFAKRWGFSQLAVTNLFAWPATNPKDLKAMLAKDPDQAIGAENDYWIKETAKISNQIVCAWGDQPFAVTRASLVMAGPLLGRALWCIRKTAFGHPAHPVRQAYTDAPEFFAHYV